MRFWCEVRLKSRFRAFHRNGFVMRRRIFENHEISQNIDAGEGFGHENRPNFFAGANFIVSRRRGSQFKCFVKWLHRREIASAGTVAQTNALVRFVVLGSLDRIFATIIIENLKSIQIVQLQYV